MRLILIGNRPAKTHLFPNPFKIEKSVQTGKQLKFTHSQAVTAAW